MCFIFCRRTGKKIEAKVWKEHKFSNYVLLKAFCPTCKVEHTLVTTEEIAAKKYGYKI